MLHLDKQVSKHRKHCFIEIRRKIQMFGIGPWGRVQKFQVQVFGYSHIEKGTSNWKPWNKNPLWRLWQQTLASLHILKLGSLSHQEKKPKEYETMVHIKQADTHV